MTNSLIQPILLLIDDNFQNIKTLKEFLSHEYRVNISADEAEIKKQLCSENPPQLILLNTLLASLDSFAICKKLKIDSAIGNIPIVLINEPSEDDIEVFGFKLGAADYITKPFKKSIVSHRIKNHIALKNYKDALSDDYGKHMSALHREIKERVDAEDNYRALVEHARDGIAIIQDLEIKFVNRALCKMTGFSEKEIVGEHLKKFITEEEFAKNTKRFSERTSGINLPRIYPSQLLRADGSTVDVELNVCVVPYGKSIAALIFAHNRGEEEAWV